METPVTVGAAPPGHIDRTVYPAFGGDRILGDIRWRRFLLSRPELEQEVLRLHQHGKLRYEMAGSLVALDLPHKSVEDYVDKLVG